MSEAVPIYVVFAGYQYYPTGDEDIVGACLELDNAIALAEESLRDWASVVRLSADSPPAIVWRKTANFGVKVQVSTEVRERDADGVWLSKADREQLEARRKT